MKHFYGAPWGRRLILTTVICGVICLTISVTALLRLKSLPPQTMAAMGSLPLIVVIGSLFRITGYTLERDQLIVHRAGWSNRFNLTGIVSAYPDPKAMKGAIRTCGNGGLFAICGWFYNRKLRKFRAFATDLERSVVVELADRKLVVTPDDPAGFVKFINQMHPNSTPPKSVTRLSMPV